MAKPIVKLNSPGIKKMLNSKGVENFLVGLAKKVEAQAKASAPVQSGRYRDSISSFADHTDRAVARIQADVDYALEVESKTGNLAKSLDAAR